MMDRLLHRRNYQNGKLTIEITDVAHFLESWQWAEKNNLKPKFEEAIFWLIRSTIGSVVPQREHDYEGYHFPARPGTETKLTISPDSWQTPSFVWSQEPGLHGGLIFHNSNQSWGIHT